MSENTNGKLFREKSLETVSSPEVLNDYLKATSPGVWLVLGAVIALLAGFILWGIFGRIDTVSRLAVRSKGGNAVCVVPYEKLDALMKAGSVTLNGREIALDTDGRFEMNVVSDTTDPFVRMAGGLEAGTPVVELTLEAELPDGVYTAEAVLESLQPISLLLR